MMFASILLVLCSLSLMYPPVECALLEKRPVYVMTEPGMLGEAGDWEYHGEKTTGERDMPTFF